MTGRRAQKLVSAVLLLMFWPQLALAQNLAPAGVVTTITGAATVARASLPAQQLPLRFKDAVYGRDTIRTGEQSVVRVLLGGKALVTVREQSVFTVSEEAGRSRVGLESGKLALAVARQRMRPGEAIEVRTPNVVAGVRGTVVVFEVLRATAQAARGPVPATSNLYVLRGSIEVLPRLPGTAAAGDRLAALQSPVIVGPLQSLSVTGTIFGQVKPIPPTQLGQILSGLKSAQQHQDTPEDAKKEVASKQQAQASALASLIAPDPAATASKDEGKGDSKDSDKSGDSALLGATTSAPPPPEPVITTTTPPILPPITTGGSTTDPTAPPAPIVGQNPYSVASTGTLYPGLSTLSGKWEQKDTNSLVVVESSTVTQEGVGNLLLVPSTADVTLKGTLLDVTASTLDAGTRVVQIDGTLSTSATLVATDPTTVNASNFLTVASGASLTLTGASLLATSAGDEYTITDDFVTVFGTLTSGPAPLASFTDTTVKSGSYDESTHFFRVNGAGATATLSGPLLVTSGGFFKQKGSAVFEVSGGAHLTATGTGAFIDVSGGTLKLKEYPNLARVEGGSTATLAGTLFKASGAAILDVSWAGTHMIEVSGASTLTAGALLELDGVALDLGGEALARMFDGSTLRLTGAAPAIKLTSSELTADALISGDGSGNSFELTGIGVWLIDSTLTVRTLGETDEDTDSDTFTLALNQPLLKLSGASTLTVTEAEQHLVSLGDSEAAVAPTESGVALVSVGTDAEDHASIGIKGGLFELEAGTFQATDALVQLTYTTVTATETIDPLFDVNIGTGKSATMTGALLSATDSSVDTTGAFFEMHAGTLTSNTTGAFLSLLRTDVTTSRNFALFTDSGSISLRGSFLDSTDSALQATTDAYSFFTVINGASVTTTATTAPLLKFTGTALLEDTTSTVTAARNFLPLAINGVGQPAPTMSLSGPLLAATNTRFETGDPAADTHTFLFVGDSAQLSSTSASALLSFTGSSVDTAGNVVTLRRSTTAETPSRITLAGPLFEASDSTFDTSSLGHATSACCAGFFVGQAAQLTSGASAPLIALTRSTFNAGPDAQSGGSFFAITDTSSVFTGELTAAASVSLTSPGGSLLRATDGSISSLFSLLSVTRSSLTSSGTGALIVLDGVEGPTLTLGGTDPLATGGPATTNGRLLSLVSSASSGTAGTPASVSLAGPLLVSTKAAVTATGHLVGVFNGATLSSTTTDALVQLENTSITLNGEAATLNRDQGDLLRIAGSGSTSGSTFASVSLHGPVLAATSGSTLETTGGLLYVGAGSQLDTHGSTDPLFAITGGTHTLATAAGTAMGRLFGRASAITTEVLDGVTVTATGDAPVLHEGVGLEVTGATVSGQQFLKVESAVVAATAALLSLKAGADFTTALDAIDLSKSVRLTSTVPLVKLDASTLTVTSRSLFSVGTAAGGNYLAVTGGASLVSLLNGSTLDIQNGVLVSLSGSSLFKIETGGSFVSFGAGANTLKLANAGCVGCALDATLGFPVLLTGGASIDQILAAPDFMPASGAGTVDFGTNGAYLKLTGPDARVVLGNTLVQNGSFEADLDHWTVSGAATVLTSFGSFAPTQGAKFALVHTGTDAVQLGTSDCHPCRRSVLSQTFDANSLLVVKFRGVLLTNEYPFFTNPNYQNSGHASDFNDTFKVVLTDAAGTTHTILATDVNSQHANFSLVAAPLSTPDGKFTLEAGEGQTQHSGTYDLGVVTSSTIVAAPGSATLSFEVADVQDNSRPSGMLIDAVVVQEDPPLFFVRDGATLTRPAGTPLIERTGATESFDSLLVVCCGSTVTLGGALLRATDSTLSVPFSLASVVQDGRLVSTSTEPLVQLSGGTYALGREVAMLDVAGVGTAPDPVTGLTLGTDRPLQHAGAFLNAADGTTVSTRSVVKLDRALLEASAPLIALRGGSTLTTTGPAVDLSYQARVTALGPLVRLDGSTLTVAGAVVNVNASVLSGAGSLLALANGSTLNAGLLVSVSGGGLFAWSGPLATFTGTGNSITLANSLCAGADCVSAGGLRFALRNGAVAANVTVTNPTPFVGAGGTVTAVPTAAHFLLSGSASKVTLAP